MRPRSLLLLASLAALGACNSAETLTAADRTTEASAETAIGPLTDTTLTTCAPVAFVGAVATSDDGNVAANAIDGDSLTRWSAPTGASIFADPGRTVVVCAVRIRFYRGNLRKQHFTIAACSDQGHCTQVWNGWSTGTTTSWERATLSSPVSARLIKITGLENTEGAPWISITELAALGHPTTQAPTYDNQVLADNPVGYWPLALTSSTEVDATGRGHDGHWNGASPSRTTLPNGDPAAGLDGKSAYVRVESFPELSITKTGNLTWEVWIRPDVLDQFPTVELPDGYTYFIGKCVYGPVKQCEYGGRLYQLTTGQGRPNRISGYVWNPSGGQGAGADFQPRTNEIKRSMWLHVVVRMTTSGENMPAACRTQYPGTVDIWVNGIEWQQSAHGDTGCFSQDPYNVVPKATSAPLTIGMLGLYGSELYFPGAVAKAAVYGYLLSPEQIAAHYRAMTGVDPDGGCSATCWFNP